MFPSYGNQSIDLMCKSIDWFLYEGNTGTYRVKLKYLQKESSDQVNFQYVVRYPWKLKIDCFISIG